MNMKALIACFLALSVPLLAASCADLRDADRCYRLARLSCQKGCTDPSQDHCIEQLTDSCHDDSDIDESDLDACADKLEALEDCAGADAVAAACADSEALVGATCTSSIDCPTSQACVNGICTTSCFYDDGCSGYRTVSGAATYCNGENNNSGWCVGTCSTSADCTGDWVCKPNGEVTTCGAPAVTPVRPAKLGDACGSNGECESSLSCQLGYCSVGCTTQGGCTGTNADGHALACVRVAQAVSSICLPVCSTAKDCATGSVCQSQSTPEGSMRQVCSSGTTPGTNSGMSAPGEPVPFERFLNDALVDEEGRYFYSWNQNVGAFADFDPGPVTAAARYSTRNLACLAREPDGALDCYTTLPNLNGTDVAPANAATERTRAVARAASLWKGVTDVCIAAVPAAENDAYAIWAITNQGLQCTVSSLNPEYSTAWLPSIAGRLKAATFIQACSVTSVSFLDGAGKPVTCSQSTTGSTASCTDWVGVPAVAFASLATGSNDRKGMGLTLTGEIAQWGFVGDDPPAGAHRSLQPGSGFACAIEKSSDKVVCWSPDGTFDVAKLGVSGKKARDIMARVTVVDVIDESGAVTTFPGGTSRNFPRYQAAIDSCTDGLACSEVIDYETATASDYRALCTKEGGTFRSGACSQYASGKDLIYTCLGQDFEVETKTINGMAYFYRGVSCAAAQTACAQALGKPSAAQWQLCRERN
jgi:hypothetical protein